MATAKQSYKLINDVLAQAMGKKAPTIANTTDLVSFAGNYNLAEDSDLKDAIWDAIIDKVREVYVYMRSYQRWRRRIRRAVGEWAIWYEELQAEVGDAVENSSWARKQANPFDVEDTGIVRTYYFKALATWEHDLVQWDRRLLPAFQRWEKLNALFTALFVSLDNTVEKEMLNIENLTLATATAGVLMNGKPAQKRNLLAEYNALTGSTLTVDNCRFDEKFLIYCAGEISTVVDFIKKDYTTIYNVEGTAKNTPESNMVVECLTEFDKWLTYNMRSSVYNEKIVKLPNYDTIPYWQTGGETNAFEDTSRIWIKNETFEQAHVVQGAPTLEFDGNGIVAIVRDENLAVCCADRIKTNSIYNPRSECTNFFKKIEAGFGVNLSYPCVVFYLAEETEDPDTPTPEDPDNPTPEDPDTQET